MEYIKKRNFMIRSVILLTGLLTLSILTSVSVFAEEPGGTATNASSVSYVERSWDENTKTVVSTNKTRDNVQPVPSDGNMKSGWYYLDRNITKDGRIESINGNVNLILGDGYTLNVKGLYVPSGWTLTIYGQSEGTGKIYSRPSGGAGIGGYSKHDNGKIIIHGGTIDAKGYNHCAGIGSNDDCIGDAIFIYGGKITATGGNDGAGIGGGEDCDSGTIRIYGGDLDVTAGANAAGIGGGENGDGEYITIYGGNISVTSRDGAAIGGAEDGDGGHTTINGGTLNLDSGNGAGIGGGNKAGDGGHITITGGVITIHAEHGAGIGGGRAPSSAFGSNSGDGGTIRISGDPEIEILSDEGYCIGAGNASTAKGYGSGSFIGSGGNVRIDGGVFTLKGNSSHACFGGDSGHFEMYGGTVNGDHPGETPDYLFWYIGNAEVEIYGGKLSGAPVRMKDDDYYGDDEKMHPCSIFKMTGGELKIRNPYTQHNAVEAYQITLADDIMVKKSKNSEAEEAKDPVPASERINTVKSTNNYYSTIKTCDHPNAKYSVRGATSHWPLCDYCKKHILDEPHEWDGETGRCTKCGYQANDLTVTFDSDNGEDQFVVSVPKGNKVEEPGVPVKRGFVFQGWYKVLSPLVEEEYDFDTPVTKDIKLKAKWENRWSELQTIIDNTPDGGTIKLGCDYTAASDDTALVIPEGKTITINLNGFAIDRADPPMKGVKENSAIIVDKDANLTVTDGGEDGIITGGSCGGVYVKGTFTLSGGSIIDNTNVDFGGGVVLASGTFNMTGGSITENSTDGEDGGDGGGVYMSSGTTFNMSGGRIKGNSCSGRGGGVYMTGGRNSRSMFNMTGGSIEYNISGADGGGVCVNDGYCTFNLSGDSTITRNKVLVNNEREESDVYLPNTNKKINITGALAEKARIGISVPGASYTGDNRPFTSGLRDKGAAENFISNNDQYIVQTNNNKEAYLYIPADTVNVTFDRNDESDDEESVQVVDKGGKAERPEDPVREGFVFLGWYQVIKAEPETLAEEEFDFDTLVMEDITLKALWGIIEPDWSVPVYVWSEDNSEVTASRTNNNAPFNTQEETVSTTIESKTDPACEEPGETVYISAAFKNTAFEVQRKTVVLDALGHAWSEWSVIKEATTDEEGEESRSCSRCDETETRVIPPRRHVHYVTKVEEEKATCEEAGNIEYYICSEGDDPCRRYFVKEEQGDITINFEGEDYSAREISLEDTIIPATDHTWDEGVVNQEPGCTSYGTRTFTCKTCGEQKEEEIDWAGHQNEWHDEAIVPATCDHRGYHWQIYQCTVCGDIMTQRLVDDEALGHDVTDWEIISDATCTEDGEKTGHCNRCGEVETQVIPALGHDWGEAVYTWSEDNSSVTATRVCGHDDKHVETETVNVTSEVTKEATCEDKGETTYTSAAFGNEAFKIQTKTVDDVAALGHDLKDHDAKDATCTEAGWQEYQTCSRCDYTTYKEIAALGHDWGEAVYTWSDGNSSIIATRVCGHDNKHVEIETVNVTSKVTKEATCEDKGETTYTSAAFGNEAFEIQTKTVGDVAALGHDLKDHDAKDATCTEAGWQEYQTCSRCDYTTYKEIAALGHEEVIDAAVEPTCTETGKTEGKHCSRCSKVLAAQEEIPALGHKWDNGTVTTEPTEKEDGVRTFTCTDCGATKTEVIPAKGSEPKPKPAPGSDPNQKGSDGTAVGPGASAAAAEKAITSMKSDTDPKGAVFRKLKLKSPKQTGTTIKLTWTKLSKAKKYVIYGNRCGKGNKPKRLVSVTSGSTKTLKKVAGKKIKRGAYYKFIIVALDKNNNVISTSRLIHVATKGGKVGNHKSVTVKKAVITKAKKLKKGKTLKLNAKAVKASKLKVNKHVAVRYESSNKKIATVSSKGVVKGKKKGTCYIYAYAQNGVFKKIKIVVK